jgi:hypothetical protein
MDRSGLISGIPLGSQGSLIPGFRKLWPFRARGAVTLARVLVLACIGVGLGPAMAFSKDLTNRLGVGFRNNNSVNLPALAAIYYPNADIGLTGSVGVDTLEDNSKSAANFGLRKILFREDNLNFYFGGQAGLVNFESASKKESGFELNVIFGAEFFFSGLDSLSLSFEAGAGLSSLKSTRFRTIGDDPFRAGIIFYF